MVLAVAFAAAALASYYTAAMVAVTALVWGAGELLRHRTGRARFVALAGAAAGAVSLLLLVVSLPYLGRRRENVWQAMPELVVAGFGEVYRRAAWVLVVGNGFVGALLAAAGVCAVRAGDPALRAAARLGLVVSLAGIVFMLGPEQSVAGVRVPLPFALLTAGVGSFFRTPWRFVVVAGFGMAVLGAVALELACRRLGGRSAATLCVAALALIVWTRGLWLSDGSPDVVRAQEEPIYEQVRELSLRQGAGPLLELPTWSRNAGVALVPEAMVGSTRHWLPLVTGYTGYLPPHAGFLDRCVAALASPGGLEALVDATRLRWILLRPEAQWNDPQGRRAIAHRLRSMHVSSSGGWDLYRVDSTPRRTEWFAALWRGQVPGRTVLGSPIVALDAPGARVEAIGPPPVVQPGKGFFFPLRIHNTGSQAWPSALAVPDGKTDLTVEMRVRALSPSQGDPSSERAEPSPQGWYDVTVGLPRDLPAGEALVLALPVQAPPADGSFVLEVEVRQVGSDAFIAAGSEPARLPFRVEAARVTRGRLEEADRAPPDGGP